MERDCESELSKLNIEQNACIYHFGASVIHGQRSNILRLLPIEEIHKHQTDYISLQVDDVTRVAALLENMRITNFSVLDKEFIHIYDSDISGKALSKAIIENGIGLESMGRKQDTLEDFFFQLTEEEK